MRTRCYSELILLETFEERFEYLKLGGAVGAETFGHDRHLNQMFYTSYEWRMVRDEVIARDRGCDLGIEDRPIHDHLLVHHMNPISKEDILHSEAWIIDPEYLITISHETHNAVHYSGKPPSLPKLTIRTPGDTKLW